MIVGEECSVDCQRLAVHRFSFGIATEDFVILGIGGIAWQWRRAEHNAASEERQRQRAERNAANSQQVAQFLREILQGVAEGIGDVWRNSAALAGIPCTAASVGEHQPGSPVGPPGSSLRRQAGSGSPAVPCRRWPRRRARFAAPNAHVGHKPLSPSLQGRTAFGALSRRCHSHPLTIATGYGSSSSISLRQNTRAKRHGEWTKHLSLRPALNRNQANFD